MTADLVDPAVLIGAWRLERRVADRLGPERTVDGTLVLEAVGPDRIVWHEAGTMSWLDSTAEVSRELVLTRDPATSAWTVRFADGREFHPWQPGTPVRHPCGADTYDGLVQVDAADETGAVTAWSVRWDVIGPAKDYTMVSRLTRIAKIVP